MRKRLLVASGLLVVGVVVGVEGYQPWRRRAFEANFARVDVGMTRKQVEALLGPSPDPPAGVAYLPIEPFVGRAEAAPSPDESGRLADAAKRDKGVESLAYMYWREGNDLYDVDFSPTTCRVVQKVRLPEHFSVTGCCHQPTFRERLREYAPDLMNALGW